MCRDAHDAPDARDALWGPKDSMGDIMYDAQNVVVAPGTGMGTTCTTCRTHASFVNSSHMSSLDRLSEGPHPRSLCKSDLSQPIRAGVSRLDGFNIDEVWDYMLKPITGLQCAILVAEHQRQLIPLVDEYVVRVMCCGSERRARSARWLRLLFLILAPCSHACLNHL